jgi:uncharacterized Zn-binding protein involved in type VI secretion
MPPSARITDFHACPAPSHVGGPVVVGDGTVEVGYVPAARLGDALACSCGLDLVAQGEATVLFGNMPAARIGDSTSHGGALAQGCPTVLIGSTAQTEALKTDKPFCEQCEGKALEPLAPGYPPVIIDAHMHIQSGNCAPLPPIRARLAGLPIGRGLGNTLVTLPILGRLATGDLGDQAPDPTHVIGTRLVSENNGIDFLVGGAGGYFVGISVALTMDMDYLHIDGYDGVHIYQEEGERRYYYSRKDGTTPRERLKKIYLGEDEDMPLDVEELEGAEGEQAQVDAMRDDNKDLDRYLADLRSDCYETWRQQRRRTELAAAANPLRLLPLYHYEPRRYIKDEPRDAPFSRLVEGDGIYIGMKMYTSQGYMPDDSTPQKGEKTREITRWFFNECQSRDVPIQTHCTPVGWYTHQRKFYIDLAPESVRELYKNPRHGRLDDPRPPAVLPGPLPPPGRVAPGAATEPAPAPVPGPLGVQRQGLAGSRARLQEAVRHPRAAPRVREVGLRALRSELLEAPARALARVELLRLRDALRRHGRQHLRPQLDPRDRGALPRLQELLHGPLVPTALQRVRELGGREGALLAQAGPRSCATTPS